MKTKPISVCLTLVALCAGTWAQTASAAKPAARAAIDGIVTKDPGSEPVKKALIELIAESQTEGGDYTAITDADGAFHIEGIIPGRYHLFAERTGMLDLDKRRARSEGRVLTLTAGQELKDIVIRLQAAAVIRGRVTDEDGDPLPNADVTVLRETYVSGRRRWEQAGGERTNDLGEYRVAGLAAGNYYVSVSPPPDFKSLIESAGAAPRGDTNAPGTAASGRAAETSYQTTYYPDTVDRGKAAPIPLHAGDEFPADFSLIPSPSLTIRGSVVNLPPHTSAVIMLQSHDFNLVLNGADLRQDGSFTIRDVSPGSYTILATVDGAPVPMSARQSLQVAGNVEGLRLAPQPGASIRGRLRLESSPETNARRVDLSQIFLALHPMDPEDDGVVTLGDQFTNLTHVSADGSFEWKDVPAGSYYVRLTGEGDANADWFVKSVLAGGRDLNDSGINVNGGAISLDLVVNANGAIADGIVVDAKGQPVANAIVVAAPEARLRSRVDRYRKTVSDQSGRFTLRGIPPGDYTLFAWDSVEGEAYYNPEFLKSYEGQGSALHISEGDRKSLQLQEIPDAEPQP
ncbi:MAG TPA: carboxypeptidase regulatory-like domain-containing protein [Terriglobales bacterium]|nr:carboxypeptidase regulatory-like domain-containing protein [Terriglobales bacterium]